MPSVEVIPSIIKHAKELSLSIREQDQDEARAIGVDPKKGVFFAYRAGLWRRTGLIDGKVAAMWGVAGSPLGMVGHPFLITGTEVEKISPVKFAKVYIEELQTMRKLFPILENYVDSRYDGAVRLLKIAGFELEGPQPVPPFSNMFYKFRMVTP